MKSEADINTELRYWEGKLDGLQGASKHLNEKIDTGEKRAIEALAWIKALHWVMGGTEKEGEKNIES